MKISKTKKHFIATAFIFISLVSNAQVTLSDSALAKILESDVLLPALIDSAVKNSPDVRRFGNAVALSEENVKATKTSLLNAVSFLSSYNYGTTGDIVVGKDNIISSPLNNFTSTKSARYNIGVNLQLPLANLLSRKNVVHSSQLQVKIAEDEKDNSILYVKQEVIRMYQEFKLSQALMITAGKTKQVSYVNYTMTNKNFLHGDGDLEAVSRLHESYSKASMEYDTYLNRFQTSFLLLQAYTGVQLTKLINKFK